MNNFDILVEYEPTLVSNWKVSYGTPVSCFKTWDRYTAVRHAKIVAKRNTPSQLIIRGKNGAGSRTIKFRGERQEEATSLSGLTIGKLVLWSTVLMLIVFIFIFSLVFFPVRWILRRLNEVVGELLGDTRYLRGVSRQHSRRKHGTKLCRAPGAGLLKIADFFFSARTVELCFNQLVADWRGEYFEALSNGRIYKAQWISMRYRYRFVMAMGLSNLFSFFARFLPAKK
jgi:hypothetical protein